MRDIPHRQVDNAAMTPNLVAVCAIAGLILGILAIVLILTD